MLRRHMLASLLLLVLPGIAGAQTLTLAPVRDNTLFEDAEGDTSNGAGPALFCGRNSQGRVRRALLAFDPAGVLPALAWLDSARLELHVSAASDPSSRMLSLHRVLVTWGEGGSSSSGGGGSSAQPGDATWLHRTYPAVFWAAPGGDFAPEALATSEVSGEGDVAWTSAALTACVREQLAAGSPPLELMVRGEEAVAGTARRFDSRESPTISLRPRLVLFFTVADPTAPVSWGQVKLRYR